MLVNTPFKKNKYLNNSEIKKVFIKSRKKFLNKNNYNLYFLIKSRCNWIDNYLKSNSNILELGSGSGLMRFFIKKKFTSSDVVKNKWIDKIINAEDIPYKNSELDSLIINHTILHLNDPYKFFREAERTLKVGGDLIIHEINLSFVHKLIIKLFNHCSYDYKIDLFRNKNNLNTNTFSANAANLELIIDKKEFSNKFSGFKIIEDKKCEFFVYLLTGGINSNFKTINLNNLLLTIFNYIDSLIIFLFPNIFALSRKIVIKKVGKLNIENCYLKGWGEGVYKKHFELKNINRKNIKYLINDISLAVGNNKSYGDINTNKNKIIFKSNNFNKIISFNKKKSFLVAESGVTIKKINKLIQNEGFMLPVTPGYEDITIGGAIANNIHGKNYTKFENFGANINWLKIITKNKKIVLADKKHNSDLFYSTLGGIGMTGVIYQASLKLINKESDILKNETVYFENYNKGISYLKKNSLSNDYCFGVINFFSKEFLVTKSNYELGKKKIYNLNQDVIKLFSFKILILLNKHMTNLLYKVYFYKFYFLNKEKFIKLNNFIYSYPSNLKSLNCLQVQAVINEKKIKFFIKKTLNIINYNKSYSHLITLKYFDKQNDKYLSFTSKGFAISFDFKDNSINKKIILKIIDLVILCEGRIYLAKDSQLNYVQFNKMFNKRSFVNIIKKYNSDYFVSDAAIRYNLFS